MKNRNRLFCFSPPVMIATMLVEVGLAVYIVWRYKLNTITRLATLILVALATFQLAEFMVCEGRAGAAEQWARIGYVAITALPPLGLHLAFVLAGKRRQLLPVAAYGSAAAFMGYFWFADQVFAAPACLGNYIIFETAPGVGGWFGAYYYMWLAVGLAVVYRFSRQARKTATRQALWGLGLGYAAFILPTAIVNMLSPATLNAIPSIMCGFAVMLAFALALWVVPMAHKKRAR